MSNLSLKYSLGFNKIFEYYGKVNDQMLEIIKKIKYLGVDLLRICE